MVGVFGYSDEDGTEAAAFGDKLPAEEIADRVERVNALVDELVAQRAEDRVGEDVQIIVESVVDGYRGGSGRTPGPRRRRHDNGHRHRRSAGGPVAARVTDPSELTC